MTTPSYEYKTGFCDKTTDWATFLNQYGPYGWEYVSRVNTRNNTCWLVTFKRVKAL